jgi:dolichyl-diphosphooligosaccharide--protein glycosyltransferase
MVGGMSEGPDAAALLEERPDLEPALRELLAVDESTDGWTFEDLSMDSGRFGELAGTALVESDGDDYRLADPEAVRAALGEAPTASASESAGGDAGASLPTVSLPTVNRRVAGAVVGALLVVVLFRAYVYGAVFRGDHVVLTGNDPYAYRYYVETALQSQFGAFNASAIGEISRTVEKGEPLLVAVLWWLSALLGGTKAVVGWVMAWYPVVVAVVVAVAAYAVAVRVTDDRRIGLAAVLLLAVTPGHAFRTSLGFADHHAFDYLWLAVTVYALARLATTEAATRDWRRWATGGLLGIGVAGQTLAWEAGPLLIVPVGLFVFGGSLVAVRGDRSPAVAFAPLVAGVGLAAAVVGFAHTSFDWHTTAVASAPVLLFGGSLAVVGIAEAGSRLSLDVRALASLEVAAGVLSVVLVRALVPEFWAELQRGLATLTRERAIAETLSLFSGEALGWLLLFGFILVLALPYMAWGTVRGSRGDMGWLLLAVYGWYLLALSAFQVRFVGHLALLTAVFAGLGFVHLAERVDLAAVPRPFGGEGDASGRARPSDGGQRTDGGPATFEVPTPRAAGALFALFLLVGGLSVVQTPVKISQIAIEEDTYQTALAANESYAADNATDSYVLSPWSFNRVYNYFVSGDSRSFSFARSTYEPFAADTDAKAWYRQLRSQAGFVVARADGDYSANANWALLHQRAGSRGNQAAGSGHYQAIYASGDGSHRLFRLVPGATLQVPTAENGTTTVSTSVTIPNDEFEYVRRVNASRSPSAVRVAYAGDYRIDGGPLDGQTVTVTQSAVRSGETVAATN